MVARAQGRSHLPWRAALLVLIPVAAFFLCEGILSLYAAQPEVRDLLETSAPAAAEASSTTEEASGADANNSASATGEAPEAGEARAITPLPEAVARMNILALFALYAAFSVAILAKFVSDLWLFDARSRGPILAVLGVAIALGLFSTWRVFAAGAGAERVLGEALFDAAFNASPTNGQAPWSLEAFQHLRIVAALLTVATVGAFVAGGISCLARFDALDEREGWLFQCERLRSYIYFSAALLVVGVLYLKAWTGYPSYLLAEGAARDDFLGLVNAYVMFSGIEYSILLAAYALPVAAILSRRADVIAARIVADEERKAGKRADPPGGLALFGEKVKKARLGAGLVFSTDAVVKAIVALLAPLITGGVASLTSFFG